MCIAVEKKDKSSVLCGSGLRESPEKPSSQPVRGGKRAPTLGGSRLPRQGAEGAAGRKFPTTPGRPVPAPEPLATTFPPPAGCPRPSPSPSRASPGWGGAGQAPRGPPTPGPPPAPGSDGWSLGFSRPAVDSRGSRGAPEMTPQPAEDTPRKWARGAQQDPDCNCQRQPPPRAGLGYPSQPLHPQPASGKLGSRSAPPRCPGREGRGEGRPEPRPWGARRGRSAHPPNPSGSLAGSGRCGRWGVWGRVPVWGLPSDPAPGSTWRPPRDCASQAPLPAAFQKVQPRGGSGGRARGCGLEGAAPAPTHPAGNDGRRPHPTRRTPAHGPTPKGGRPPLQPGAPGAPFPLTRICPEGRPPLPSTLPCRSDARAAHGRLDSRNSAHGGLCLLGLHPSASMNQPPSILPPSIGPCPLASNHLASIHQPPSTRPPVSCRADRASGRGTWEPGHSVETQAGGRTQPGPASLPKAVAMARPQSLHSAQDEVSSRTRPGICPDVPSASDPRPCSPVWLLQKRDGVPAAELALRNHTHSTHQVEETAGWGGPNRDLGEATRSSPRLRRSAGGCRPRSGASSPWRRPALFIGPTLTRSPASRGPPYAGSPSGGLKALGPRLRATRLAHHLPLPDPTWGCPLPADA
ncbi:basic proline-rich protein-like [Choloepus didactylus]|uniref:basic proline-rich protein-like n=1 Tax=Choloepus didactylus TaxID=27675 RepID=UPI00189F73D2|nr:basic proline-rich protein-like [Choloepus didactylus]